MAQMFEESISVLSVVPLIRWSEPTRERLEQKVAKDAKKRRNGRPEGSDLCFLRDLLFKSGLPIDGRMTGG
jgi:hypothetical protein